jgi:hypothetical protein
MGMRLGGRKAGVPNKANLATRLRIEQEADPIGRLLNAANTGKVKIGETEIDLDVDQYLSVLRELRRVIVPDAKSRAISLSLPPLGSAQDVSNALGEVFDAMARGEITVDEAATVAGVLEQKRRAVELADLEARLTVLEGRKDGG